MKKSGSYSNVVKKYYNKFLIRKQSSIKRYKCFLSNHSLKYKLLNPIGIAFIRSSDILKTDNVEKQIGALKKLEEHSKNSIAQE